MIYAHARFKNIHPSKWIINMINLWSDQGLSHLMYEEVCMAQGC